MQFNARQVFYSYCCRSGALAVAVKVLQSKLVDPARIRRQQAMCLTNRAAAFKMQHKLSNVSTILSRRGHQHQGGELVRARRRCVQSCAAPAPRPPSHAAQNGWGWEGCQPVVLTSAHNSRPCTSLHAAYSFVGILAREIIRQFEL